MIKKIVLLLIYANCFADCKFEVFNYSNEVITAEVGIRKHDNAIARLVIPRVLSKAVLIKSDASCTEIDPSGVGMAYINLIGGKSKGGWIYSPQNNRISAIGASSSSAEGAFGYSANGSVLWLQNNYKPKSDVFQVVISKADRNTSKPSSLNPY